jgi:hypothetical protein
MLLGIDEHDMSLDNNRNEYVLTAYDSVFYKESKI